MAISKTVSQISILLATLASFVCSQQATAPGDANTLFSNLLATSNPGAQQPTDPNGFSAFGTANLGASVGGGVPAGISQGFLGPQPSPLQPRGMPSAFNMPSMGGMSSNAAPPPVQRSGFSNSLMPYAFLSGSDAMQRMAMASMLGGGGGASPFGAGGMMGNPLFMYSLMNSM